MVQHRASSLDSRSLRVVLRPDGLELIQVMRAQDGPVPCQVVKVVHDDGHKEVDDLWEESRGVPARKGRWHGDGLGVSRGPGGVQGAWVSMGPGCLWCRGVSTGTGGIQGAWVSMVPGGVQGAWVSIGPGGVHGAWGCPGVLGVSTGPGSIASPGGLPPSPSGNCVLHTSSLCHCSGPGSVLCPGSRD